MTRIWPLLIVLLVLPVTGWADRPPTGLLVRTGPLPATIPLQVRAPQGRDYAVVLTDAAGAPVVSGYLRDGAPLRLLVPPGEFGVTIAQGVPGDWQGPDGLFGPEGRVTLPDTLTFAIDGNRRQGHALTVGADGESLRVTDRQDRVICQLPEWDTDRITETTPAGTQYRYLEQEFGTRSRPCD